MYFNNIYFAAQLIKSSINIMYKMHKINQISRS